MNCLDDGIPSHIPSTVSCDARSVAFPQIQALDVRSKLRKRRQWRSMAETASSRPERRAGADVSPNLRAEQADKNLLVAEEELDSFVSFTARLAAACRQADSCLP